MAIKRTDLVPIYLKFKINKPFTKFQFSYLSYNNIEEMINDIRYTANKFTSKVIAKTSSISPDVDFYITIRLENYLWLSFQEYITQTIKYDD